MNKITDNLTDNQIRKYICVKIDHMTRGNQIDIIDAIKHKKECIRQNARNGKGIYIDLSKLERDKLLEIYTIVHHRLSYLF